MSSWRQYLFVSQWPMKQLSDNKKMEFEILPNLLGFSKKNLDSAFKFS